MPKREGYIEEECAAFNGESEVSYERNGTGGAYVELLDIAEFAGVEVVIAVEFEDTIISHRMYRGYNQLSLIEIPRALEVKEPSSILYP